MFTRYLLQALIKLTKLTTVQKEQLTLANNVLKLSGDLLKVIICVTLFSGIIMHGRTNYGQVFGSFKEMQKLLFFK